MVDYNATKGESSQQAEPSTSQAFNPVESSRSRSASVSSSGSQASYRSQRDSLHHRILHLSELLRVEKANRDENISCYVDLVSKADREKAPSIRQAFERINQRSSANIAHLERRLQDSLAQLKKLEQKIATAQEAPSTAFPAQQQLSPKSNVSHQHLSRFRPTEPPVIEEPSSPEKENGSVPERAPKYYLHEESKQRLQELNNQFFEIKLNYSTLENECHTLNETWEADKKQIMELLQEEKKRHYNLEIQVNDAIQLNLNEITNLKHDLACTEEKMVYQSYERSRDIWEILDSYQTRIAKLETQEQAQQQEAMDQPQAGVYKLYVQLMNVLLAIAAILLVCCSTISACFVPLLRTRWRALTTLLLIILIAAVWKYFSDTMEWKMWFLSAE